jgi:hypothetical protein
VKINYVDIKHILSFLGQLNLENIMSWILSYIRDSVTKNYGLWIA